MIPGFTLDLCFLFEVVLVAGMKYGSGFILFQVAAHWSPFIKELNLWSEMPPVMAQSLGLFWAILSIPLVCLSVCGPELF